MQTSQALEYHCQGYNENLPKGKASGSVVAGPSSLVFNIQGQQISLPYHGCELEIGGASDRLVFIRHPMVKDWTFFTSDRRILKDPRLKTNPSLLTQLKRLRQKKRKHFAFIALALALFLGTPAYLLFSMDKISGVIAKQVPREWEEQLGESTLKQYSLNHELLDSKQSEELLLQLVQPLLDQLKRQESAYQYRFHIAKDTNLNAFALPGGYVVIHSQLILEADNAEELLGVLAHEMMHVEQQHGIRNVIGAAGIYTVINAFFGDVSGIFATIAGAAPFLLNQSYSRDFEREADKKGAALLEAANINPKGLASFFKKMIDKEKKMLEKIEEEKTRQTIEQAMKILSTHPASEERIAYLNEFKAKQNGSYLNLNPHFYDLQQKVSHFVTENDTSAPANSQERYRGNH